MALSRTLLVCACLVQCLIAGRKLEIRQNAAIASSSAFLRRAYQASTVADHWLYIDGGTWSQNVNGQPQIDYASTILSIDLSTNWTNTSVVFHSTNKPPGVPNLNKPSLWYDEARDTLYSGFTGGSTWYTDTPQGLPTQSLWSFKPDGAGSGAYNLTIASDDSRWSMLAQPTPDNSYQAFGPNSAWTLGGTTQNSNTNEPDIDQPSIPGYVEFDMYSLTFTNRSGGPYDPSGGAHRGSLVYVPAFGHGGQPMLVALGGTTSNNESGLLPFSSVSVFDPIMNNWFTQKTTGAAPSGRIEFCAAGVTSTNLTYEIFVYAGWGTDLGTSAIQFDTISILTLPAFHWINVPYEAANPRHGHSCNWVGGSQIISVGGADSKSNPPATEINTLARGVFETADPFTQGLAIFDMTKLAWVDQFVANKQLDYEQSDEIKQFYASNNGAYRQNLNANVERLMFGDDSTLPTNATNSKTPSNSSPLLGASNAPPLPTPGTGTRTGAILGAVAGGLAALLLSATAILLIRLRRRRTLIATLPPFKPLDADPSIVEEEEEEDSLCEAPAPAATVEMQDVKTSAHEVSGTSQVVELLSDEKNVVYEMQDSPV